MTEKKTIAMYAVLALVAISFAGFSMAADAGTEDYGDTISVASSPDFPPYDYMYGEDFAGIELDIVKAIGMEMGVNINFIPVDFDSILAGVAQGAYDVGASGFTINDERKQTIDFSDAYTPEVKQVFLVKKNSGVHGLADIEGKKLTSQSGTTGCYYVEDLKAAGYNIEPAPYQTYSFAVQAVLNGQADILVVDDLVAYSFVNAHPNDLELVTIDDPDLEPELYGFIFAKGGSKLETDFNNALKKLMANGTVDKIYAYYGEHNYDQNSTPSYYNQSEKKTISVASSPDFPPYDYMYGDDFAGIELDIVKAIGVEMGVNINFIPVDFDSILAGVAGGSYDVGASGFTINEERKKAVDFSDAYTPEVKQVFLVKKDSGIHGLADVKGKVITSQSGTTGCYYADDFLNKDGNTIMPYQTYSFAVQAVLNGQADILVVDDLVAYSFLNAHPSELEIVTIDDPDLEPELYGFIFAKGGSKLETDFNNALKKLMANGTVDKIYAYYGEHNYDQNSTPSYYNQGEKKTITVASSPDFPPYDYMYGDDFAGIELDIVKAIGKELGVNIEFIPVDFDSILAGVSGGSYMVGASGFTINEERKKAVDFSDAYTPEVKQVFLVKKDSGITCLADVKGKIVTSQSGTTGCYYADDFLNKDGNTIMPYQTYSFAVQAVLNGQADVLVVDDLVAYSFLNAHPEELMIVTIDDPNLEPELYGFIFAKGGSQLETDFNNALKKLMANGTVDKIYAYYGEHNYDQSTTPSYYNQGGGGGGDDPGKTGNWFEDLINSFIKSFVTKDRYKTVIQGFINTIEITLIALVIGLGIGALTGSVRTLHDTTGKWKIANAICKIYITIIRGTPVMIQLLIIYFVIFASSSLNPIIIASVAFGLNSGAYVAEIIRAGINAVPKGQMEACESLGMPYRMSMMSVIMPQAIRNILPALCNEGISLLKETSIAGYIGVVDLTFAAKLIVGQTYEPFMPYITVAIIYLIVVLVLQYLVGKLEKRLNNVY